MNWGDPSAMEPDFLFEVDAFLSALKQRFFITSGTQGKHAEHSLHYSGRAVDFVFVDTYPGHILDAFLFCLRFRFTEVGVYPKWKLNGKEVGGLHCGMLKNAGGDLPRKKLWMGVPSEDGKQVYIGVSSKNLIKYGVLKGEKV